MWSLAPGWRIVIPGEMEEKWEEGNWCAWSEGRTVWFSSWSLTNEGGPLPDPDEMLSRIKETDVSVPFRENCYYYWMATEKGK